MSRYIPILFVLFTTLFPVQFALAGVVYTSQTDWESGIPYLAPVIEVTVSGTPEDSVPNGTMFGGVTLNGYLPMVIGSAGDQVCLVPDGVTIPRVDIPLGGTVTTVFGLEVTGTAGIALGCYDTSLTAYETAPITPSPFAGEVFDQQTNYIVVIGAGPTDTVCVGPFYVVDDVDGDGPAGDIDCDEVDNDLDASDACSDCDDADASVYPGAIETEDGLDNDCDGTVDEGTAAYDDDGDGVSENDGDCNDADVSIFPTATETCDGVDQDCDGITDDGTECYDDDGDGYTEDDGDCDDSDVAVYPGATETANGIDDDCDGTIDDGTIAYDDDGDGVSENDGDCNDTNASVSPTASETCNTVDDNCDGVTDEGFDSNANGTADCLETDSDGDGSILDDCAPEDPAIYPDAEEICDEADNNCDGAVDDTPETTCYDDDGDSYSEDEDDCDDANPLVSPAGTETCNGVDDDCNGDVDEGFDQDGDGVTTCVGDCDDGDVSVYPGAEDVPDNGIDEDCDGSDATAGDDDTGDDDSGDDDSATPDDDDTAGDDDTGDAFVVDGTLIVSGGGCRCQGSSGGNASWLLGLALLVFGRRRRLS